MTDEQGANEIKYRVDSLLLLSLLGRGLIRLFSPDSAKKGLRNRLPDRFGVLLFLVSRLFGIKIRSFKSLY